jgi:hypothetical protein
MARATLEAVIDPPHQTALKYKAQLTRNTVLAGLRVSYKHKKETSLTFIISFGCLDFLQGLKEFRSPVRMAWVEEKPAI